MKKFFNNFELIPFLLGLVLALALGAVCTLPNADAADANGLYHEGDVAPSVESLKKAGMNVGYAGHATCGNYKLFILHYKLPEYTDIHSNWMDRSVQLIFMRQSDVPSYIIVWGNAMISQHQFMAVDVLGKVSGTPYVVANWKDMIHHVFKNCTIEPGLPT